MAALREQVQVELADRRQEAVRVVVRRGAAVPLDLDEVGVRARHLAGEEALRSDLLERDDVVAEAHAHRRGARLEDAHDARAVDRVEAEHAVRIVVLAAREAPGSGRVPGEAGRGGRHAA